jgi:hypothetical protein
MLPVVKREQDFLCLKLKLFKIKGDFREYNIVASVAKLGFPFVAMLRKKK